jgi:single-strand DNA-binding protein
MIHTNRKEVVRMSESTLPQTPPELPKKKPLRLLHLNEVRLAGRLTHDPQVRSVVGDKMIVHLNLAVNRSYRSGRGQMKQQVTFVPVTVWNRLAGLCADRLAKGCAVYVEGTLRSDRWKTTGGDVRTALKVHASRMQLITRTNGRLLKREAAESKLAA